MATISHIEKVDNLSHVTFQIAKQSLEMLSLELNSELKIGSKVHLCVKSTDITIAKNLSGKLSCVNQLKAKIKDVNNGKIVSSIELDIEGFTLESIIMLDASLDMNLNNGDDVTILIKGSELSIC